MAEPLRLLFKSMICLKAYTFERDSSSYEIGSRAATMAFVVHCGDVVVLPFGWEIIGIMVVAYLARADSDTRTGGNVQFLLDALQRHSGLGPAFVRDGHESVMDALAEAYAISVARQPQDSLLTMSEGVDIDTYLAGTRLDPPTTAPTCGCFTDTDSGFDAQTPNESETSSGFEVEHLADGTSRLKVPSLVWMLRGISASDMLNRVDLAGLFFECPYRDCVSARKNPVAHLTRVHGRNDGLCVYYVDIDRRFYVMGLDHASTEPPTIVWRLVER